MDVHRRLEKQGGGAMMDGCSDGDSAKIETEPALLHEIDRDYVSKTTSSSSFMFTVSGVVASSIILSLFPCLVGFSRQPSSDAVNIASRPLSLNAPDRRSLSNASHRKANACSRYLNDAHLLRLGTPPHPSSLASTQCSLSPTPMTQSLPESPAHNRILLLEPCDAKPIQRYPVA